MGPVLFVSLMLFGISSGAPKSSLPESIVVDIKDQGRVRGNYDTTAFTRQSFMQFRGLPYAESPRGSLRFKAPVERRPWTNDLDATNWGRRCPEITTIERLNAIELQQDLEDCLHLCVYTKNLSRTSPVMVYIHGGSFFNGTSIEHPANYLMESDIVLVVPQYRLGVLGFLSTGTSEIPGNAALDDCLLALKWVQRYIRAFGGDPENVTIFGQSAGAVLVGALLLSPKSPENSFHRAILQSGSIFSTWSMTDKPLDTAKKICNSLGCTCQTDAELNACFMKASVPKLMSASNNKWLPLVLGDKLGLLPRKPMELVKQMNKTIMIGFAKHDGSFLFQAYYEGFFKSHPNRTPPTVREFIEGALNYTEDPVGSEKNLQRRLFFNRSMLDSCDHAKALPAYFDLLSFQYFKSPALTTALQFLKNTPKTYFFTFDYEGENTRFGYENGTSHLPFNGGVTHSNDNLYLFPTHQLNSRDEKMAMKMTDYWTSFATNGAPYSKQDGNLTIEQMKCESGPYFHINEKTAIGYDVYRELTAAIDDPESYKLLRSGRMMFL